MLDYAIHVILCDARLYALKHSNKQLSKANIQCFINYAMFSFPLFFGFVVLCFLPLLFGPLLFSSTNHSVFGARGLQLNMNVALTSGLSRMS